MTNTNNTNKMRTTRILLVLGSSILPFLENAQGATSINTINDVQTLLERIVGWAQVFFYILATLFIILAAWDYLQSNGEAEKVKKAKERIIYSLVAIVIAVIAGGVVVMVKSFIG